MTAAFPVQTDRIIEDTSGKYELHVLDLGLGDCVRVRIYAPAPKFGANKGAPIFDGEFRTETWQQLCRMWMKS